MDISDNRIQFNWELSLGLTIVTADNQKLGIVEEVVEDAATERQFLRLRNGGAGRREKPVLIPVSAIGIVTPKRMMLDLTAKRFFDMQAEQEEQDEFDSLRSISPTEKKLFWS